MDERRRICRGDLVGSSSGVRALGNLRWSRLKACNDGGCSNSQCRRDRPPLGLLADIRDRRIDIVVVYKVDRLTRSLADFAKLVELFDAHGVSFVSVTQQFNGRLPTGAPRCSRRPSGVYALPSLRQSSAEPAGTEGGAQCASKSFRKRPIATLY
jgi:hypothetical protein